MSEDSPINMLPNILLIPLAEFHVVPQELQRIVACIAEGKIHRGKLAGKEGAAHCYPPCCYAEILHRRQDLPADNLTSDCYICFLLCMERVILVPEKVTFEPMSCS